MDLKIWRKRFKLSTLEYYSSLKEEQISNFTQDSTYQIKSDFILEEQARAKTKENIKNYFDIIRCRKKRLVFYLC